MYSDDLYTVYARVIYLYTVFMPVIYLYTVFMPALFIRTLCLCPCYLFQAVTGKRAAIRAKTA